MTLTKTSSPLHILIIRWICFFIFVGRAYQHLFWDAPYRTLLWDESLLKGIVETLFDTSWNAYATSQTVDHNISILIKISGGFYLLCGIAALYLTSNMKKLGQLFLCGGALGLCILAILYCKEKFFHVGQFFEYTLQFISPVLLYLLLYTAIPFKKIRLLALIAIALTFSCHGLYAIGYYPRPGHFIDMTINSLPISESSAHSFLKIAGILDFIVSIAIFIPRLSNTALWYTVIWGGLTAIARLVGHFHIDFIGNTFHQWTWEVLIRMPHALISLFLIVAANKGKLPFWKLRTKTT